MLVYEIYSYSSYIFIGLRENECMKIRFNAFFSKGVRVGQNFFRPIAEISHFYG